MLFGTFLICIEVSTFPTCIRRRNSPTGIPKSLDIVMLLVLVLLWTEALLQHIVFYVEEILSLGKERNKMLLSDHPLNLSIG